MSKFFVAVALVAAFVVSGVCWLANGAPGNGQLLFTLLLGASAVGALERRLL